MTHSNTGSNELRFKFHHRRNPYDTMYSRTFPFLSDALPSLVLQSVVDKWIEEVAAAPAPAAMDSWHEFHGKVVVSTSEKFGSRDWFGEDTIAYTIRMNFNSTGYSTLSLSTFFSALYLSSSLSSPLYPFLPPFFLPKFPCLIKICFKTNHFVIAPGCYNLSHSCWKVFIPLLSRYAPGHSHLLPSQDHFFRNVYFLPSHEVFLVSSLRMERRL